MPGKLRIALFVVLIAVLAGVLARWRSGHADQRTETQLYGNVDLRQVDLPFNDSERVAEVLVQEGDRVQRDQVLARLDTSRIDPQVARAEAELAAQQQAVDRLHHGSRPQEIDQARASVAAAEADALNARAQYQRLRSLADSTSGRALSQQDLDAAHAASDAAQARLVVSQKALALQLAGPRAEDIAQAEAQLRAQSAALALLRQQRQDAELRAPLNAIVRSRIVEPGEISSPQKAAFTLAIIDPKWVRAYVPETDRGRVHEGMKASVTVDAFAGQSFPGWVGFISPTAEFTPKPVETPDLRTSLVYEVRVFVKDPDNRLGLGSPATVHLPLDGAAAR